MATFARVNGPGLKIDYGNKLKEITFYPEGSSVNMYVTINEGERDTEALMYLSPEDAMKFAKAMEASAIEALKYVSA